MWGLGRFLASQTPTGPVVPGRPIYVWAERRQRMLLALTITIAITIAITVTVRFKRK